MDVFVLSWLNTEGLYTGAALLCGAIDAVKECDSEAVSCLSRVLLEVKNT